MKVIVGSKFQLQQTTLISGTNFQKRIPLVKNGKSEYYK